MSNFLTLVNEVRSEAGESASLTTVESGLNATNQQFANWVRDEWKKLQAAQPEWQFLRQQFEFDTVANTDTYSAQTAKATSDGTSTGTAILANWKLDSLRISTVGQAYADEVELPFMDYDNFRRIYQLGSARAQRAKPLDFSVRPSDQALVFGSVPDAAYTVGGEFYRTPQVLALNTDEPLLPAKYHPLIVFRALRAYGVFMAAPELITRSEEGIAELYPQLCAEQLPAMRAGPPLA